MAGEALGIDEGLATAGEVWTAGVPEFGKDVFQFSGVDERARV